MADEADQAQQFEQLQLAQSLSFRRDDGLPRRGQCYNCGSPLQQDALFCDSECEQDFQRLRRMRAQRVS